jgi:hypothetical protein
VTERAAYRWALAVAVAAAFLLVWMNAAVGIIGNEDNAANLLFAGVLLVGVLGAALARLRARAMARVLVAMAAAQALVPLVAWLAGIGPPESLLAPEVYILSAFFTGAWLLSAGLFRQAARHAVATHAR